MALIQVADMSFTYEGGFEPVFEHVSFQIDTDWKLGFTGRNGRGKTTFLKLLMGELEYSGTISTSVEFDYFPFLVEDKERETKEILEQVIGETPFWQLDRELSKLQVAEDVLYRPFSTLSNGEQTKVLLAALFVREGHFLLIDEPTNHLDREARQLVSRYLNSKKGFILVSHDRAFLDGCVDHILSINRADIEVQKGNFSSWYENRQRQDAFEWDENERLKKDIRRLKTAAKRSGDWADKVESTKIGRNPQKEETFIGTRPFIGEKSRRMQQRRKNLERRQEHAIEEKRGLLKNVESVEDLKLFPLKHHSDRLVTLEQVAACYGKPPAPGLKVSYVCQDTGILRGGLSEYARSYEVEEHLFRALLRKLDFSRELFDRPMESYSEGQKKKVLIARSLCEQAHLYIWDEPLNFIDVYSRMQIEELILKFQPTLIFVEHDDRFTEKTATQILQVIRI